MPRSVRVRARSTGRRSAVATVLCAGGVALLLAGWKLDDGQAAARLSPSTGRWLTLAAALAVLVVAAARRLPTARAAPTRIVTLLAVLVTLAATGYAGVDAAGRVGAGFPGVAANLGVLGGLAVLLGLLSSLTIGRPGAVAPVGSRRRVRSIRRSALAAGASAAVLLLASTAGIVATSDRWTVRTRTVSAKAVPAVPAMVSKVGWSVELPSAARAVARAGAGAVALVEDGVLGIDGARGAVWWSYRRLGSSASWLAASPDGGVVAVALNPPRGQAPDGIVILDAMTGRPRARLTDGTVRATPGAAALTDDVLVAPSTDGLAYRAYALSDGRLAWSWLPPVGCRLDRRQGIGALPHEALAVLACPQTVEGPAHTRLIRLDSVTGAVRGEQRLPSPSADASLPTIDVAPDSGLAMLRAPGAAAGQRLQLFEPATGELRPARAELRSLLSRGLAIAGIDQGAREQLVDARTGERRDDQGLVSECAGAGLLLESAVLCGRAPLGASRLATAERSGRLELVSAPFGGQPAVELPIDFGLRAAMPEAGSTGYVAANGAVIVYLRAPAASGVAHLIVGLQ
jgi:hypothetical protein